MVVMSYIAIGLIYFVKYVSADGDDVSSCLELFDPEVVDKMCCESLKSYENVDKDYEECFKDDSEEWLCEDFECFLQKMGSFKDGKIDDDAVNKYYDELESDYPNEKSFIGRVRHKCLDGKYETYPPEDACPAVKFYVCGYINAYLECDTWKDLDVCTKMSQNAQKCKAALGN